VEKRGLCVYVTVVIMTHERNTALTTVVQLITSLLLFRHVSYTQKGLECFFNKEVLFDLIQSA
jgi:hypothetical protein